jgi:hypothetical protein
VLQFRSMNQVEHQLPATLLTPLDERRLAQEAEFKRAEIALKEREIAVKETELQRSRWLNPTVLGLFAAAIGLMGNVIVAGYNSKSSREIAQNQAQSNLILQAVTTGNFTSACQNIISLIELGLVNDPTGSLRKCATGQSSIPVLPISSRTYTPPTATIGSGTYAPPMDEEPGAERTMNVRVTRKNLQHDVLFHVTFTIPAETPPVANYDQIFDQPVPTSYTKIESYAFKVSKSGQRIEDREMPEIHGNWKPGELVGFDVKLPSTYVNDVTNSPTLIFCVGTPNACFPSQNLLLSEASMSSNR